MIFSIQRDLEDYFNRCGLGDPDQYAVALARLYDRQRGGKTLGAFLSSMGKIRTAFFRANQGSPRAVLERKILSHLDGKFKKKVYYSSRQPSPKELRHQAIALHKFPG
jgi:hypothetical protein